MILFMYHWIWFTSIVLKMFVSMFISDIGLCFSFFLGGGIFGFGYQGDGGLIVCLGVFPPLQFCGIV